MSDTPLTDSHARYASICGIGHVVLTVPYDFARQQERLLRDCYHSGGLPPELMRRVGEALGVKE